MGKHGKKTQRNTAPDRKFGKQKRPKIPNKHRWPKTWEENAEKHCPRPKIRRKNGPKAKNAWENMGRKRRETLPPTENSEKKKRPKIPNKHHWPSESIGSRRPLPRKLRKQSDKGFSPVKPHVAPVQPAFCSYVCNF